MAGAKAWVRFQLAAKIAENDAGYSIVFEGDLPRRLTSVFADGRKSDDFIEVGPEVDRSFGLEFGGNGLSEKGIDTNRCEIS